MFTLRNSPMIAAAMDCVAALGVAVAAMAWAGAGSIPHGGVAEWTMMRITLLNVSFSIVFVVLWKQCLTAFGLYRRDLDGLRSLAIRTLFTGATMTAVLGLYLEARHVRGPLGTILLSFFAAVFVYQSCRVLLWNGDRSWQIAEPERVLILGSGRRASIAWRELRLEHYHTKRLLGFVDDRNPALMPPDIASRHIATLDELANYFLNHAVDELIVAVPMRSCHGIAQQAVSLAEAAGVRVMCLNDLFALHRDNALRQRNTLFVEMVQKDTKRQTADAAKRIHWPLALDLKILARAVPAMLKRF